MADEHRRAFSPRARLPSAYPRTGYPSNWSPSRCRPASRSRELQASSIGPSVVALPEHTALSSRRLPTLELDAVASLFKARCADPSPHRCLKHAPALPSPPYLDNQQSTRVHPVALNLLPPPLCANRCRASPPSQASTTSSSLLLSKHSLGTLPLPHSICTPRASKPSLFLP